MSSNRSGGRRTALRRLVVLSVLAGGLVAGCGTVNGSAHAPESEVSAYRSEISASRAAKAHTAGMDLCRQAMSSMVVMVRGYNAFVRKLNDTQSYDRLGGLDDRARASLIAGGDLIRGKVVESTPADVADPARTFLGSTKRLGDAIARRQRVGLNPIATTWTNDKRLVLRRCARYIPPPPPPTTGSPTPTTGEVPAPR